jgi:hypothetical protein
MDVLESAKRLDCLHLHVWEDDGGPAPHASAHASADASASGATDLSGSALVTTVAAKTPVALLNLAAAPLSAAAPNGEGRREYRYSNLSARWPNRKAAVTGTASATTQLSRDEAPEDP